MATTRTEQGRRSSAAMTVLVVERDDDIRIALVSLLEDEGYRVLEAENLPIADSLLDTVAVPVVLLIGDAEAADNGSLEFYTMVAANPATNHAYVYLTTIPRRWRLPALVQMLKSMEIPTVDIPFELASLLAVVAAAAERVHS